MIRFIPYGAEHITIHLAENGVLMKNYSLPHIAEPTWENEAREAAKKCYKDWEKHLKYAFAEMPLPKIENINGYHLLGRLIDLSAYSPKEKYKKHCDLEIIAPYPKFMLDLYLSTPDKVRSEAINRFQTSLGDICFEISELINVKKTEVNYKKL